MTDHEFDQVNANIRAGHDVRVQPLNYAPCVAHDDRGARERMARMLRGEREINVYPSCESTRWIRCTVATPEQVQQLVAVGARLEDPASHDSTVSPRRSWSTGSARTRRRASSRMFKVALALVIATSAAHAGVTPQQRAKALLDVQAKAINDNDQAPLDATLAPDVIALVPEPRAIVANADIAAIRRTSPHESLNSVRVGKIVAGGDANAVWVSAELVLNGGGAEPEETFQRWVKPLRVTELLTADSGWKVVAAAFTEAGAPTEARDSVPEMPAASAKPTALADLLADPTKLDAALGKDASVTVFGTDANEKAYGAQAAHTIVQSWRKLALARVGGVHEGHGKGWAYAMSYVDWTSKKHLRMCALVLAQLDAAGAPTIVALHYVDGR